MNPLTLNNNEKAQRSLTRSHECCYFRFRNRESKHPSGKQRHPSNEKPPRCYNREWSIFA